MKITTLLTALLVGGFFSGTPMCANAKEHDTPEKAEHTNLQAEAKISRAEAKKIALAKVPGGKVKEAELENEDGILVWSLDLKTPGTKDITEVLVDAKTGAVVSVAKESPEVEAKEKAEEKRKGHPEKDDDDGEGEAGESGHDKD